MSKHITIYYGPVQSLNLGISHKPQFVYGLRDRLRKIGYRVDLSPVQYVNYCMLEINGYEVFKCNIKYLAFNMPYKKDPICQLAVKAVKKSAAMFAEAGQYMWLKEYLMRQLFNTSKYKEQWFLEKGVIQEMADFKTCAEECCRILFHKNPDGQESESREENPKSKGKSHDEAYFDQVSKAFSHHDSHIFILPTNGDNKDLKQRKFEFKTTAEYFKDAQEKGLMSQLNVEERVDNNKSYDNTDVNDIITDVMDQILCQIDNIVTNLHSEKVPEADDVGILMQ